MSRLWKAVVAGLVVMASAYFGIDISNSVKAIATDRPQTIDSQVEEIHPGERV